VRHIGMTDMGGEGFEPPTSWVQSTGPLHIEHIQPDFSGRSAAEGRISSYTAYTTG
jgi:hypothetical protein